MKTDTKQKGKIKSKGENTPQPSKDYFSWIIKNLIAVAIALLLLNTFVFKGQEGYKWSLNMLENNHKIIKENPNATLDDRYMAKLGASYSYLQGYLRATTPDTAVILLPGRDAFFPKDTQEQLFQGEPYNKLWATRFLYPRRVIIPQEIGKTPWSEKVTHVAIINGHGYEYLDYEVEKYERFAVLPIHLENR